jgi:transposase
VPTRVLSPRQARWLLVRPLADLHLDESADRTELLGCDDDLRAADVLVADFFGLVRARDAEALTAWLDQAAASRLPEFRAFAEHVRRDRAAVEAALTNEWSNGQTEGQINRLKSLKRSMFGRAAFDLLRRRVLHAA